MSKPKCPKCESTAFESVSIENLSMSFICCSACGAIIAHRDNLLVDKLSKVAETLEYRDTLLLDKLDRVAEALEFNSSLSN